MSDNFKTQFKKQIMALLTMDERAKFAVFNMEPKKFRWSVAIGDNCINITLRPDWHIKFELDNTVIYLSGVLMKTEEQLIEHFSTHCMNVIYDYRERKGLIKEGIRYAN